MKINIHDQKLFFFKILAFIDYFYSCFIETA